MSNSAAVGSQPADARFASAPSGETRAESTPAKPLVIASSRDRVEYGSYPGVGYLAGKPLALPSSFTQGADPSGNDCALLSAIAALGKSEAGTRLLNTSVAADGADGWNVTFRQDPSRPQHVSPRDLLENKSRSTGDATTDVLQVAADKWYKAAGRGSVFDFTQPNPTDRAAAFTLLTGKPMEEGRNVAATVAGGDVGTLDARDIVTAMRPGDPVVASVAYIGADGKPDRSGGHMISIDRYDPDAKTVTFTSSLDASDPRTVPFDTFFSNQPADAFEIGDGRRGLVSTVRRGPAP